MKDLQRLMEAYAELERLSESAVSSLRGGLDMAVLGPIFERKAALCSLIGAVPAATLAPSEGLQALLEAQKRASQAEAALVQALQPWISSVGKLEGMSDPNQNSGTGQRWDFSG